MKNIAYILLGAFFLTVIAFFSLNAVNQTSVSNRIQKSVKTELYNNRDDSARVNRNVFYLQQSQFESSVVSDLSINYGLKETPDTSDTKDDGIAFSYLVKNDGDSKAVTKTILDKDDNVLAVKARTKIGKNPYTANIIVSHATSTKSDDITNR